MNKRLTKEEIEQANKLLIEFNKMLKPELIKYIDKQIIKYDKLTILEAYILYKVKEIEYNKEISELNNKIRDEQIERNIALKRS